MIRKLILAGIAMMTIAISSCDEDTNSMGNTLTVSADLFNIGTDTFNIPSMYSLKIDSVLSRSQYSYLGRVKDPETGAYVACDYTTQFFIQESESSRLFAPATSILGVDEDGNIVADSCFLNIVINSYMGDSLAAMKLTVNELARPVEENRNYYTNYDIEEKGYLRTDGLRKSVMYSICDLTLTDSVRNLRRNGSYFETIKIPVNTPYTDTEGNTYNNYGTYIMRQYYAHPEYFKNSLAFTQHVCPGFHFKITDGVGMMAEIKRTQLSIYYHYKTDTAVVSTSKSFDGTEEVMQTNHFTNDASTISRLVEDETCTYLKTPSGIYTVVQLPVNDIKRGHESDTIASAKIAFRRMNNTSELSNQLLKTPKNLLMLEYDSLYSFFENRNLPNNVTSYVATYSSSDNSFTFSNISGLINHMWNNDRKSANWDKVVLVPVQVSTTTTATSSTTSSSSYASVNNDLRLSSIRLVGGAQNQHAPVRISVIYNKNK